MNALSTHKYVTFTLGKTNFAIPVTKTREIVDYMELTAVPEAPDYIKGVINIRGGVIPVIDLGFKFYNRDVEIKEETSIMIIEPTIDEEKLQMGLLVDTVEDVIEIKDEQLEPPPKYGLNLRSEYIQNVVSFDEDFILILDIDMMLSLVSVDEVKGMQAVGKNAAKQSEETEES